MCFIASGYYLKLSTTEPPCQPYSMNIIGEKTWSHPPSWAWFIIYTNLRKSRDMLPTSWLANIFHQSYPDVPNMPKDLIFGWIFNWSNLPFHALGILKVWTPLAGTFITRNMQMIISNGQSHEASKSMCFWFVGFCHLVVLMFIVLLMLVPLYVCERMIAGSGGLTTRRHQFFIRWSDVLCIKTLGIDSNWTSWNLNVQNWDPPQSPKDLSFLSF